jgi:hypothetical protein
MEEAIGFIVSVGDTGRRPASAWLVCDSNGLAALSAVLDSTILELPRVARTVPVATSPPVWP